MINKYLSPSVPEMFAVKFFEDVRIRPKFCTFLAPTIWGEGLPNFTTGIIKLSTLPIKVSGRSAEGARGTSRAEKETINKYRLVGDCSSLHSWRRQMHRRRWNQVRGSSRYNCHGTRSNPLPVHPHHPPPLLLLLVRGYKNGNKKKRRKNCTVMRRHRDHKKSRRQERC